MCQERERREAEKRKRAEEQAVAERERMAEAKRKANMLTRRLYRPASPPRYPGLCDDELLPELENGQWRSVRWSTYASNVSHTCDRRFMSKSLEVYSGYNVIAPQSSSMEATASTDQPKEGQDDEEDEEEQLQIRRAKAEEAHSNNLHQLRGSWEFAAACYSVLEILPARIRSQEGFLHGETLEQALLDPVNHWHMLRELHAPLMGYTIKNLDKMFFCRDVARTAARSYSPSS